ncbi:MAG: lyase, partial [Gemmatimonadaceae bacterium]
MLLPAALLLAPALLGTPLPLTPPDSVAADSLQITEWPVPWKDTRPRDPYVDARNNRIWFVGQTGDYAAYLEPAPGQFKRYALERG